MSWTKPPSAAGVIGAIGVVLCWLSAYVVLPAGLTIAGERIRGRSPARLGELLGRITPEHQRTAPGLLLLGVTSAAAVHYLTSAEPVSQRAPATQHVRNCEIDIERRDRDGARHFQE
jgi:hypothetical protein